MAGRVTVIGGAGSNATFESERKAAGLVRLGIDGLLLITPYYNKSNEEGIYRHFTADHIIIFIVSRIHTLQGKKAYFANRFRHFIPFFWLFFTSSVQKQPAPLPFRNRHGKIHMISRNIDT